MNINNLKEFWQRLNRRRRIMLGGILGGTILLVIAGIIFLQRGSNGADTTLFTGLSQDEAQQIAGLLQEDDVEYRYEASSGSIFVSEDEADQERVRLLSEGYPKSGFTYSMYTTNAGLMSTESDKELYTLYDLQDRLGATIRLFDGVSDAKVTIAKGDENKYALSSKEPVEASASAVITMKEGEELSSKNADAIKNLIARSVKGINFTNVSVFNADTMEEVNGSDSTQEASSGITTAELTQQVEANIAANVRRVVGKLYGVENVAVSVKGTLNMSKLISESTVYHIPDRNEEDESRLGLLDHETGTDEASGQMEENAAGVVGTDANADTPRYVNQDGTDISNGGYYNNTFTRDWLYDVLKEQKEVSPGVLEDASVAVVINTSDTSIENDSLVNLVADAAGIPRLEAQDKITIIRAGESYDEMRERESQEAESSEAQENIPVRWLIISALASLLLIIVLVVVLLLRRKRLKKREKERMEEEEAMRLREEELKKEREEEERILNENNREEEEEEEYPENPEERNRRHLENLISRIGDFAESDPQAAAKLLESWLHEDGGEEDGN